MRRRAPSSAQRLSGGAGERKRGEGGRGGTKSGRSVRSASGVTILFPGKGRGAVLCLCNV